MSVLIVTSIGDIVIDLYTKECPKTTLNFIKLCKIKYYNNCLFYDVQKDFIAQTGDPENTGRGGNSIYGILNKNDRYFDDEIHPQLRHNKIGIVSTANLGPNMNTSTFFIQLTNKNLPYLNDKHTVFGIVEEGLEVLEKFNKAFVDKDNRPYKNIRIKHTIILDDPFQDPIGLIVPAYSPEPVRESEYNRLEDDFDIAELYKDKETEEKVKEKLIEHEAKNRAIVLEMLEDLPDADVKPPENVLFVCKLNPVTQDDDLELIFSRFGPIKSCQIVRDWKTGQSLQYAFIEYENTEDCEQAFFKMNGVCIDERRIKVDFSQSVSKYWHNLKKSKEIQVKKAETKNEVILPNENVKLEIKSNRDFMNHDNSYKLVFDGKNEDRRKHSERPRHDYSYREEKDKDRHSHHKRHHRSRSRSRSRSRRKERSDGHRREEKYSKHKKR